MERLTSHGNWTSVDAYRFVFYGYAILGIFKLVLSLLLSRRCEPEPDQEERNQAKDRGTVEAEGLLAEDEEMVESPTSPRPKTPPSPSIKRKSVWPAISKASRVTLVKLCLLFAVDSLASGLVATSWVTSFFNRKFSLPEGQLGTLFSATNLVAAACGLVASSIAKRIGNVKAMVFTHLPSSIWLALIPFPSNVRLAMAFLILRSSTASMDQAPRQAFLSAVVLPSERTAVMGVVNVVKTLSQSIGPYATGWLAGTNKFWVAFLVAGAMKASYDLGMLGMFLGFKSREDQDLEQRVPSEDEEIERDENGERRR